MRCCLAAVAMVGCFSPNPPTGVACGINGRCPPGQFCDLGTCQEVGQPGSDGGDPIACEAWPYTPGLFDPCEIPLPGPPITTDVPLTLDADAATLGNADGASIPIAVSDLEVRFAGEPWSVKLVSVADLRIDAGGVIALAGSSTVVLVSWGETRISGELTASANRSTPAAGANPPICSFSKDSPAVGEGGGGGGGFAGVGGGGGGHDATVAVNNAGLELPQGFYGGCSGQRAGTEPGSGAGVVAIVAIGDLVVTGSIAANGGGGGPGSGINGGGSGGGAGGLVYLEGNAVSVSGRISANGGGGGGGEDSDSSGTGGPGANGALGLAAAPGGLGELPNGGTGGSGGAGNKPEGNAGGGSTKPEAGGGGGGGAAGQLLISPTPVLVLGAELSPVAASP